MDIHKCMLVIVQDSKDQSSGDGKSEQGEVVKYHLPLLNVLAVLIGHMKFTGIETRLETLRWLLWLHKKLPKRVIQ